MTDDAAIVVAIWREGSLTRAAQRLDVSLATVSRRLSELEAELGVVLFERTTRSLRATPAGDELARRLERGLAEIQAALRRVQEREDDVAGVVRVSVPPSLAGILAPIFGGLRERHPGLRVHVYATEKRLQFAAEDIDVLLRVGQLVEEHLVARPVGSYRHMLCATAAVSATITAPAHLAEHPCLMWGRDERSSRWLLQRRDDDQEQELTLEPAVLSNDYALLAQLAVQGAGVAELPAPVAAPLLRDGTLHRVLPEWQLPEVTLSVLYARRLLPSAVKATVSHITEAFSRLDFS